MKCLFFLAFTLSSTLSLAQSNDKCSGHLPPDPMSQKGGLPVTKFVTNGIAHSYGKTASEAYWNLLKNIEESNDEYLVIGYGKAVKKPLNISQVNIVKMGETAVIKSSKEKGEEAYKCETYYATVSVNGL